MMLDGKPLSCAPETSLRLVNDQQRFVFLGKSLEGFQISGRRHDHAPGGNDWLDDDRGNIVVAAQGGFDRGQQALQIALGIFRLHWAAETMGREKSVALGNHRLVAVAPVAEN